MPALTKDNKEIRARLESLTVGERIILHKKDFAKPTLRGLYDSVRKTCASKFPLYKITCEFLYSPAGLKVKRLK